ncbi:MAG: 8-oxo-dGTP diphosphatase MutT, partial [Anaerolineae bacterium]|nr:8-oxo-dGTP diphosphatase MutT [Anaerolineae bacterium]
TAGAIASISFGRDVPVVDGNVTRVLCRYFKITADPKSARTQNALWQRAGKLLPRGRAGDFNQALMELGATVCTPRAPRCDACPLARGCQARRLHLQDQLPTKRTKKKLPHYEIAVGIIWKRGKILIAQRPAEKLLGGLWEFPGGKRERNETRENCLTREVREELGIEIAVGKKIATIQHAYSHFKITMHAFECRWVCGRPRALGCAAWKWVAPRELSQYAFPAANRKIIARLMM